jgi:hypothetical protein
MQVRRFASERSDDMTRKTNLGLLAALAAGVLVAPLAAAQDSSPSGESRMAQAWHNFQQKAQDDFRQNQQRLHDALASLQVAPPQSFSESKGQ